MKSVEELKNEAMNELVYDNEQAAKNKIKQTLQSIVEQQKIIANATKKISELKTVLSSIEVESVNI